MKEVFSFSPSSLVGVALSGKPDPSTTALTEIKSMIPNEEITTKPF
jgi:hypothetical protein